MMASIPSSPSSISFESTQASSSSPLTQQQQQGDDDGDDGDVVILRAIEKLHVASVAFGPEDDNQDDDKEDKAGKEDVDGVDSSAPGQQEHPASTGSEQSEQFQQQQQPQQPSLNKLEIDRLTQEKHALEKQMKDMSTQFAHQLHALQMQLHQQTAAHDRKEQEWKEQEKQLQKTRSDAVDDARRVQAQVQLLKQRVRELEELVPSENNGSDNVNDSQPQQALTPPAEPTLHLTQRQSYSDQRQYHHQPSGNSSGTSHPHAVQRSVVGSTTRPSSGSNVMCHPQNPRSDCSSTVRITHIGRNRSAPSGAESADTRDSSQTQAQASPTTDGSSSSMMPPLTLNSFQWREVASSYERQGIATTTTGYRGYLSPPQQRSSTLLAPMSVRPSTFYPTQSCTTNNYPQQQRRSPVEYSQQFVAPPPATGSASPAGLAPESTTLISICPIPEEASTPGNTEPQGYGFRLEKKPSSRLLAYCSELFMSSLAPAASVSASVAIAPSATGANNTNTVSSNAKVVPAWQLFNSSNSQLGKQMSLDVEQGFSPPRPHQIPLEMQQLHQIQQQQQQQGYFTTSSSSCNNYNSASAPQFQPSYQGSPISSPPPQHGCASSVLPTHSSSPF